MQRTRPWRLPNFGAACRGNGGGLMVSPCVGRLECRTTERRGGGGDAGVGCPTRPRWARRRWRVKVDAVTLDSHDGLTFAVRRHRCPGCGDGGAGVGG
jgi:hypothetical protein